ncbi:E3 ubiquitin-protein ligase RNF26-like isoform X1 [Micropterus salmoides]|uniref:E3 ubiquitin-protein ligase RNF26-like isoform X1 n=1 Tax=Micropterus salmoides TaxID=27706 RepID=UPI0018ED07CA|nr:E3 ubiquitin-protein ligase RNF26-like isoform X1 [Micropterus salmoides]XP_038563588.1 E3 ubiquitin-protein ligase RNF26-like isoform X1 [Micropterus salmoides]
MDEVNFVSLAVGRCVDACCLLLDLVVRTFSWLLRFLSGVAASFHNTLVALSGSTLVEYSDFALFSFLTATEAVSGAACGVLHVVEGWLQTLGGVFESFKMVGHLSCHVAWRVKDVLHRGFISGSCILRQTCEGLCIALSLVLYFVNTVVNIVLISMQNCLSVLACVWEVVADPLHKVVELALTLLTFLYSCLVGASVLLWTPCQLLLDFVGALGRVFITVFIVDSHGLLITAAIISVALLLLNPWLPVLARRLSLRLVNTLPGARGVHMILEQALANQEVHTRTAQEVSRSGLSHTDTLITETDVLPANELSQPNSLQFHTQQDGELASGSRTNTSLPNSAQEDGGSPPSDGELLNLLKEQEERKKCVICQDFSKTVLLLPCRHLCLCRHCADILTQRRPSQQRCCPLCRQPITQTMDVFL